MPMDASTTGTNVLSAECLHLDASASTLAPTLVTTRCYFPDWRGTLAVSSVTSRCRITTHSLSEICSEMVHRPSGHNKPQPEAETASSAWRFQMAGVSAGAPSAILGTSRYGAQ